LYVSYNCLGFIYVSSFVQVVIKELVAIFENHKFDDETGKSVFNCVFNTLYNIPLNVHVTLSNIHILSVSIILDFTVLKKFLIHCIKVLGITTLIAHVPHVSVPLSTSVCVHISTFHATVVLAFAKVHPLSLAVQL